LILGSVAFSLKYSVPDLAFLDPGWPLQKKVNASLREVAMGELEERVEDVK
jgi:hypothetical protein